MASQPDDLTRTRIKRVHRKLLDPAVRAVTAPVSIEAHHVHGEPITWAQASAAHYEPFAVGDRWGPMWDTTWLRIRGSVPEAWADAEGDPVLIVGLGYFGGVGFGAEGLVWVDGEPRQGISPNHDEVPVPRTGDFELHVEAAANPPIDALLDPAPDYLADPHGAPMLRLSACHLALVDRGVEALRHDLLVLLDLYEHLDPATPRSARILHTLDRACSAIDPRDVAGTAAAAREVLRPELERPAAASAHRYAAVANAHIDTAWLWPLRETRRKCARTFSTVATLLESEPDMRFAVSQAAQLQWIAEDHPALFERLRAHVASGAFEPVGSMWVEADCNVPSGESLVRQVVHGKRWYLDTFGVETTELWLPDVFGYSAALPQILRSAGIDRFLTQKLSWNQVNRFPHHTFWWEGIDGSRVFTHFPPADTYNGTMELSQLVHGERNFSEKAIADRSFYLYGWGDGGGGPTRHMLARARCLADLDGAPRVELCSPSEAWAALEADVDPDELPVWVGELYFEMHRGTYTTHSEVKRANRTLELALRDAELWSVACPGAAWPGAELDSAWKELLLHQFHDIIPGSSIQWVYRDTAEAHARLAATVEGLVRSALSAVVDEGGDGWVAGNPLAFDRREVVELGDGSLAVASVPSCGCVAVAPGDGDDLPPVVVGDGWMANGVLHVEWDSNGLLTSVRHVASGREALAPGCVGNLLQAFDDRPNVYDAWDIDAVAYESATDLVDAESVEVVTSTPDRVEVEVVRRWRSSTITQVLRLDRGSGRIEVHGDVDWQESNVLLKAAFPLAVRSPRATFEIQHGHVERPTHRNTSWDEARFEVCAQTWADVSEAGFGVALLNDCLYGHDVLGNVLRLTLLRSPTWPDPAADKGRHVFAYALLPHEGGPVEGGVVPEAHAFNSPLRVMAGSLPGGASSFLSVDDPHVVVTAVKAADDGEGVVVRLYESSGGSRRGVRLRVGDGAWSTVERVDLLERPLEGVDPVGDGGLDLRPFELVTLRFRP